MTLFLCISTFTGAGANLEPDETRRSRAGPSKVEDCSSKEEREWGPEGGGPHPGSSRISSPSHSATWVTTTSWVTTPSLICVIKEFQRPCFLRHRRRLDRARAQFLRHLVLLISPHTEISDSARSPLFTKKEREGRCLSFADGGAVYR